MINGTYYIPMKTKIFYTILFTTFLLSVNAQDQTDALRYSQTFNGGTARFMSMGGAFGALGGDFSSISYNPAGLGVYRSSEFTITPSFKKRSVNSDYNNSNGKDYSNRLGFDNLGFVFSFRPNNGNESGLVNLNLAFGYNRTNDYNTYSYANGKNSSNSIMDYFANKADGYSSSSLSDSTGYNSYYSGAPWDAIMAWRAYLINPAAGGGYIAALNNGDGVNQSNTTEASGSSGDYLFSLGVNISNKLYLGASLSIQTIDYTYSAVYHEKAFLNNDTIYTGDRFNYLNYYQNFETGGRGYNLKIGGIYKPIDGLRLGFAIHTPTYYQLEDTYSYSMYSDMLYGTVNEKSPNGRYDYRLETPFKTIASIAYTFKDFGLLSIDVEHINYSTMRLRNGNDFVDANDAIHSTYRNVNNIKIGSEIRLNKVFLRAGYALYPSPYKRDYLNQDSNRSIISGGVGYRSGNFFIDAAYLYTMQNEKYVFYDLRNLDGTSAVNPVNSKITEGKFLATVGFKF